MGGAVGDALGAPTEFMSLERILSRYGAGGVSDYVERADAIGRITDDTQMILFTAEALLRAEKQHLHSKEGDELLRLAYDAYCRWLITQNEWQEHPDEKVRLRNGWLLTHPELFRKRAPGATCLSALQSGSMGTIERPLNDSKGCGGVMRVAPVGLVRDFGPKEAFRVAAAFAAITHGHPSGYLSAGMLAALLVFLREGASLPEAIAQSLPILRQWKGHLELLEAVEAAVALAQRGAPTFQKVEELGGGWIGEEALAIALYCALVYPDDFESAIVLAINHSGDTDNTGAITGNILGLMLGEQAIPSGWLERLELNNFIGQIAEDLFTGNPEENDEAAKSWEEKYPPR